jgi:hypothetical protein
MKNGNRENKQKKLLSLELVVYHNPHHKYKDAVSGLTVTAGYLLGGIEKLFSK